MIQINYKISLTVFDAQETDQRLYSLLRRIHCKAYSRHVNFLIFSILINSSNNKIKMDTLISFIVALTINGILMLYGKNIGFCGRIKIFLMRHGTIF